MKTGWSALLQTFRAYIADDDPLVAAANLIAVVVATNQPFYPLYIYWFVSPDFSPALYLFLSTPFFAVVPAVSRWNATAGRVLLPLTGIANSALAAKLFGVESGVELFLLPTVLIAFVVFRPGERIYAFSLTAIAYAVFAGLHGRYGAPVHLYSIEEYASFVTMNATSAGTLTVFVGMIVAGLIADGKK